MTTMTTMTRLLTCATLLLPLGSFLGGGCAVPVGDEASGPAAANDEQEMMTSALAAPPVSCLTAKGCENYPCPNGDLYYADYGPLRMSGTWSQYGSSQCPGYRIIDIMNPGVLQAGKAQIQIRPYASGAEMCPNGTMNVFVYGHNAAGWSAITALTAQQTCVYAQGLSGIPWVLDEIGGYTQYDQLRVLAGATGSSGQIPIADQLIGCTPRTCSSEAGLCGSIPDLCGGTLDCRPCGGRKVGAPTCTGTSCW